MQVLVTGGSGRLGRSVLAVLAERGHDVVSVDVDTTAAVPSGVSRRHLDLLDTEVVAEVFTQTRPEAVVHLAGIAVPFSAPDADILRINTCLAWTVLSAAISHGARSAVAASSPTVFGYGPQHWRPQRLPLDEDHPVAPCHSYGLSKVIIEETVRTLARAHPGACALAAIRPGYVIAPEEWAGAPTQQGHTVLQRLEHPELAAGSLFNYIDAHDAGELFAMAIERPERLSPDQVLHAVADDALARRPLAELLPAYHPGTAELADGLTGTAGAFATTAARALGWRPRHSWRTRLGEPEPPAA
ncbi:NAD-dependent epimerase/dehydratase family protein [Salinactinospora qingdaonensis]|uniref:NAD(P)-dependent oxidoreductase n=1 Tax=Salinactinospora qingdaonensis TaxID=702744 RepID=A0ABP7FI69_9ACTN